MWRLYKHCRLNIKPKTAHRCEIWITRRNIKKERKN
jgi:hypothetical protein